MSLDLLFFFPCDNVVQHAFRSRIFNTGTPNNKEIQRLNSSQSLTMMFEDENTPKSDDAPAQDTATSSYGWMSRTVTDSCLAH